MLGLWFDLKVDDFRSRGDIALFQAQCDKAIKTIVFSRSIVVSYYEAVCLD